jgi:hypothetical protein
MIKFNLNQREQDKQDNKLLSDYDKPLEQINIIKENTNKARSQLDNLFKTRGFSKYWLNCDVFKYEKKIITYLATNNYYVSNAWVKCYEMLGHFDLINFDEDFTLFDNAAFPGSFILSVHHYYHTRPRTAARTTRTAATDKSLRPFKWYASSLLGPNFQTNTELEDEYKLYKKYKNNWMMNESNNGDVLVYENQIDFYNRLHNKINLYTSDLGFDSSSDYNNQELLQSYGNVGQILTGLLVLKKGGNFITKQFTFFEPITISIMYIASLYFDEFYICKPYSSREANSETYLIGKGFKGSNIEDKYIQLILNMLKNKTQADMQADTRDNERADTRDDTRDNTRDDTRDNERDDTRDNERDDTRDNERDDTRDDISYIHKIPPLINLEEIPIQFYNILLTAADKIYNNQINKINNDIQAIRLFKNSEITKKPINDYFTGGGRNHRTSNNNNSQFNILYNKEIKKYHDKYEPNIINWYKENPIRPLLSGHLTH